MLTRPVLSEHTYTHAHTHTRTRTHAGELHANPPELHAAVDAAEAGLMVDVEVGHQPLQGVHSLQTRDARLPHRRAELLTAHSNDLMLGIKD